MNYNYGSDCLEGKTLLYSYYDARIVGVRRTEQSVGIIVWGPFDTNILTI